MATRARLILGVVLGLLLSVAALPVQARPGEATEVASPLPLPPGLRTQVEFWKKIFTTYSAHEVVIHDTLHLDRTYEVLDFRSLAASGASDAEVEAYMQRRVRAEKERLRALLVRLHQLGPHAHGLSPEERRIRALFPRSASAKQFLRAADKERIRAQRGLRERFAAGVEVSRRYLPEMEAIFRRKGLPWQLTRLPLVESSFNVHAYSKAGAAGIWQFIPSTGRHFMLINDAVDERRDPFTSTEAAADYLKANYDILGNWPLAITAYNHGRAGIARAVAEVGSSDLMQIIRHYHGPAFKFASRNFYAEFLAALEVEQHFTRYFGALKAHRPLRVETVVVPDYVSFKTLARTARTSPHQLAELNPALSRRVLEGKLHVPRGYRLHLPAGAAHSFRVRYARLPASQRHARQRRLYVMHRVRRGQTLSGIARRYGTTVAAIQRRNNLRDASHVRAGQTLVIPKGES